MKSILIVFLLLITTSIYSQEYAKNRLIVKYKPLTSSKKSSEINQILNQYNYSSTKSLTPSNQKEKSNVLNEILLITFKNEIDILKAINQLSNTGEFLYVEPDYIGSGSGKKIQSSSLVINNSLLTTPDDTYFTRQWGFKNDGTFPLSNATIGADVDMTLAWDVTTGNSDMIIAVLDSGIRFSHPEFSNRLWVNPSESNNNSDSDNNGYKDDLSGWDFANFDNDPTDDHGHGTNVTGILLANGDNNNGYAGVNWKSKIMPLKILDKDNNGFYSWWIEAINYAVNNGAKVINMSVGGSGYSNGMKDAVDFAYSKNVVITVSMHNENNDTPYYPSAYTNTIAVGSTDPDDKRSKPFFWSSSSGSNYGSHIDVVAPGNYIYGLSYSSNIQYNTYWGGTSQAAPLVAGICSLILDQKPNLTVEQVRSILRDTAEDQVGDPMEDIAGWDKFYGAGRVNANNALQKVLSTDTYSKDLNITLFPNPTNGRMKIDGSLYNYEFTIYDILGKIVSKGKTFNNSINLPQLKKGIYTLKLKSTFGVTTKKIIKN